MEWPNSNTIKKGAEITKKRKDNVSEEELAERVARLKTMGKVIGEDFDMDVTIGTEPGWRYIFKPVNRIEIDPNDIQQKSDNYCLGVIAHEGSHRKISRIDFIPKSIWQETGFSFLMNAVEDPRVNNWVSEKYDGAAEWIQAVSNEDISTEEKIQLRAKQKLGYTPKHMQFGFEVIRRWHTGLYSPNLPFDVREALEVTYEYAKMAYETLPDIQNPTEKNIEEKAQDMYRLVYGGIWPKYQELIDAAFEDEKLRQMIKEMMENGELELPPEALQEPQQGKNAENSQECKEENGGTGDEKSEKNKENHEESKKGGKGKEPKPLDGMSEDLREKIKQALKEKMEGMMPAEQKEFEERAGDKAEENLDELEEEINKELKGKFSDQPETSAEKKKRGKEEKEKKEKEKKRNEEIKKVRQEVERMLAEQKTEYDRVYEDVAPYISKVSEDIINLFTHQRFPKFKAKFPGQKLRLKGAMDYESKKDYKNLFEQRLPSERESYDFLLLVDLSGSMSGDKIEETFKGVVLLAEALERAGAIMGGVRVSIYGFQDVLIPYKNFDEKIDDVLRKKMSFMKYEPENRGKHNRSSHNSDGYCVWQASDILEKSEKRNKFLWVLSDGQPAPDHHRVPQYKNLDTDDELRSVIKDISSQTTQHVLGIGLGSGTDHVSDFYSENLPRVENMPDINIHELSETLAKKIQKTIGE